ncbi:unnamed protein product [Clonostachys chloroleuca]|uniref:Uncharacterized protein n=1 Tax=Clonostachys chloroleuca TaxID=1926264 RepID=A0AA35M4N1_9HYPO|nr:unnamed protein product [Clonostachys chloroleuca]
MIRPKWPGSQATTASIRQCANHHRRFISSSSAPLPKLPDDLQRQDEEQQEKQAVQWPGLRRRTPSSIEQATAPGANTRSLRPRQVEMSRPVDRHKNMLVFTGLSKNLVASDFYRLSPESQSLSAWGSTIKKGRTSQKSWEKHLGDNITKDFGPRPAAVLLHADPPDLAAEDLHDAILRDGDKRDSRWKTPFPVSLLDASTAQTSSETTSKLESYVLDSLRGRFVLAFPNEWEARRFQRGWNQRQLELPDDDLHKPYLLNVSFINW